MACAVPAADILALCLDLAGGDLDVSMAEVMRRGEAGRQWRHDEVNLTSILFWLGVDLGLCGLDSEPWPPQALEGIPLRAWVRPMLERGSVYCNDEGEWWEAVAGEEPECNRRCRALLAQGERWTPQALQAMVEQLGLTQPDGPCPCTLAADPAACTLQTCWRRG